MRGLEHLPHVERVVVRVVVAQPRCGFQENGPQGSRVDRGFPWTLRAGPRWEARESFLEDLERLGQEIEIGPRHGRFSDGGGSGGGVSSKIKTACRFSSLNPSLS